jgi:predicted adenylyl cyclase CyaB
MARNIEIKARIARVEAMLARAQSLADGPPVAIDQDDTFFAVAHGRLKLRRFADGSAELIQYHRPDDADAKASDYVRVPVADADALATALDRACGTIGRVRKRRLLLMAGQTRIHLDRVEGLGDFLELEVVLRDGQSDADGIAIAERLMAALDVAPTDRLAGAYLDLGAG